MSALNRWLSRLQLSPRSQRVLTEAVLDWRHEVSAAKTPLEALWMHGRASVGMLRALMAVCGIATADVVVSRWMLRLVLWQGLLLLIFRATWRGWVVSRIFTSLPVAVALVLITGPAGPSPVVGFAVIEFVVCGVIIATTMDQVGSFSRVGLFVLLMGNYIPLAFVADRVRAASARAVATLAFLVIAYVGPAILSSLLKSLFGNVRGDAAAMSVSAATITAIWLSIVWFQERAASRAPAPCAPHEPSL